MTVRLCLTLGVFSLSPSPRRLSLIVFVSGFVFASKRQPAGDVNESFQRLDI